jgi:hypothetical protein
MERMISQLQIFSSASQNIPTGQMTHSATVSFTIPYVPGGQWQFVQLVEFPAATDPSGQGVMAFAWQ